MGRAGKISTLWHEFGHFAEWNKPGIYDAAVSWRKARAQHAGFDPNTPVRINDHVKATPELGIEDHFTSKYVGRHYGADRTTEVFTMGIQNFSDPQSMAQLYMKDPEHFLLTLGMLD